MALDFDQFPVYDPIVKKGMLLSDIWMDSLATFFQTLITYLSSGGIFLPQLTSDQRDALQSPINGQMIYNTTLDSAQYYKGGVWTSF